jgi:tripartite-type tricarboxylate transporter receptor subunit TctC
MRLCLSLLCLILAFAAKAETFPSKPVRIVPFGTAGGPVDIIARMYAERLRARWKQPVIVEPKPGASGTIAADAVAKAPPDGTTILITLSLTHINNVVLQKNIPYDPFRDFQPLSQLAVGYGPALLARADAPFDDLRGMVEHAKKKQGGLTYGTWGTGSTPHLYGTLLAKEAGVPLVHVPYKGEAAAHLDLAGGALDLAWANSGTARNLLKSGKVKVLGATGSRRSDVLPDTPLFGEQGFKGFEPTTWIGAYAPAKTPGAIVEELAAALREATHAPEIAARWHDIGFEPTATTPEEFARIHKADFPKWAEMIKAAGLSPE